MKPVFRLVFFLFLPASVSVAGESDLTPVDLTSHWVGYVSIGLFLLSYLLVMAEEFTHLRKSKPVILVAGIIWGLVAWYYADAEIHGVVDVAVRHNLLEYTELMLFLLVAMTYINAMEERGVFDYLRSKLIRMGLGLRALFWITGSLAFIISPVADNLTTALLMCAVVMAVGKGSPRFISLACINIVIAANAGGAFSPFGDITTLMVWQKGMVPFWVFFSLLIPSLVNFLVPAIAMHFAVPDTQPVANDEKADMKRGAVVIIMLFLLTIITAVSFHNFLHLPPVIGMLTGLGYLQFFGYYLKKTVHLDLPDNKLIRDNLGGVGSPGAFDIFSTVARAEWDTLLFFYGVVLCVGGLGFIGYLSLASDIMYTGWGANNANIAVGLLSAIVDNIPVMFAVLTMQPDMSLGQWLMVTLTAGVGGSLLSIGSAAGVALMGQARGYYTFFSHLKWTPVIAAGYFASIYTHMLINSQYF